MHYILWVELDGFYTKQGAAEVIHRDKFVLDASALARQRGILPGMPLPEAKAIWPEGSFLGWEEEPYRDAQASWLEICADYTDVVEPIEQHIVCLDLSAHPQPTVLAEALLHRLHQSGWKARAGAARTRWVARLACRGALLLQEALDGASFIAPLPVALLPLPASESQQLEFLGYRTIGQVAGLPLQLLRSMFGERSIAIHRAAMGRGETDVKPLFPPDSQSVCMRLEGPAETVEALHASLGWLSRELGALLRQGDWSGKTLEVFLETEEGTFEVRRRAFARSIQSEGSVYACLSLLFARPPEAPTVGIRVRMPHLAKAKRIQRDLMGQLERSERDRSAMAAFAQIRTVFGDQAIQTGAEQTVPRRTQLLRTWKDATGWS
ncbi:MAG: hypothetical protein ACOYON_12985 [Fimbriimonas sp.]